MDDETGSLFLAADIGGTRTRLLLARVCAEGWRVIRQQETANRDYAGVEALLEDFPGADGNGEQPVAVCLAIAGAIENQNQSARMTNLPWNVEGERLRARFGFTRLRLINDFAAQAHGLVCLGAEDFLTLYPGDPEENGVRALIGAGTGLGMAMLAGTRQQPLVLPSQGGLADFAPRGVRELALFEALLARHGRVSLEMLLSGHGLERIYRHVVGLPFEAPPEAAPGCDAAAISAAALAGEAAAGEALRFFARILVVAASNLALTVLPRGGVYLTGGIVPRVLPFLREPELVEVFRAHPLMGEVLARIPLYAVRDELLGLKGAARIAAGLTRDDA
ncbi:MAG: glucokinase [Azoarcus sp.]|nr:glucokinase [Azoarcus sp.]